MNIISGLSSITKYNTPKPIVYLTLSNSNFTSPVVSNNNQIGISYTSVPSWPSSGTGTSNDCRILNNLTGNNASPYTYNAVVNGQTITTVLYMAQDIATAPQTITLYQNVSFPSAGTYYLSAWIAPRKTYYNNSQSFSLSINNTILTTNSFTTGTTTQPFIQVIGTWTCPSAGSYPIQLKWIQTAANDSTIIVTGIQLYH